MASNKKSPSPVRRSSVQNGYYTVHMDISQDGRRLALSGYNNTEDTFINLFALGKDPGFQDFSLVMTSQPYFSKEFTKMKGSAWRQRCVCLLDDSVFVTCCGNTIKSYDTKHGRLVMSNQRQFTGEANCMTTTRDGIIYVGLYRSDDVIVFDRRLDQINEIKLKGLQGGWPIDIIVSNNKLFIITLYGRALMYNLNEGVIEYEFKTPNQQYRVARSITVSEENGLIYILWYDGSKCAAVVVVYSFPGVHSSFSGCFLVSLNVSDDSCKTRVSNNVNRLFVVTEGTGEVREYYTNDIINFENHITLIELLINEDDCEKLLKHFDFVKVKAIKKSGEPSKILLQHLREKGKIVAGDIRVLITACKEEGIHQVANTWTNYQQFLSDQRQLPLRLKESENQRRQLNDKLTESENHQQKLTEKLNKIETEKEELNKKLEKEKEEKRELTERHNILHEDHQQFLSRFAAAKNEKTQSTGKQGESDNENQQLFGRLEMAEKEQKQLKGRPEAKETHEKQLITPLDVTEEGNKKLTSRLNVPHDEGNELTGRLETTEKESRELKKELKATKEEKEQLIKKIAATENEMQQLSNKLSTTEKKLQNFYNEKKRPERIVEVNQQWSTDSVKVEETLDIPQESIALAGDYAKLMVHVAEELTLENTLRLALLYRLPESEKDMLRRISLVEIPGIKFTDFMQTRNIINMYDVTNLQKGLLHLQLYSTNRKYVEPYQQKVDPLQFEENRVPELVDWPDEENESLKSKEETSISLESEKSEEGPQNEKTRRETLGAKQNSQTMDTSQPYIEHKINYEGGTIFLEGISLSIPNEAVYGDHIISMTVFRGTDLDLFGGARKGRMTPLIKLEPEDLKLNKPVRLTIPHSAIILEPDRHNVIIIAGRKVQGESKKGCITWTEKNDLKWELGQQTISLDINTMSYIFVNLASEEMEQKHMFRVVPFVDSVLDVKDDVLITVCFCKDNDTDYQLLLDDYKSKIAFGSFRTFQVSRILNGDKYGMSNVRLTMSPQIDSYHLKEENATKLVDTDHLCAASRVSVAFRLKQSKDGDDKTIDVKLEASQGGENKIDFDILFKVKTILLSRESQGFLLQRLPKEDLQRYESLKNTVSRDLQKEHCEKLVTFFELTPTEMDTILTDSKPGMVLLNMLDEKEIIMPDKVFGLYQALKSSHLNKIGRHVMGYIDESQKEKLNDTTNVRDKKKKTEPVQEKHFKLTRNAMLLVDEGYERLDVQRALKLSHGKLDLGRSILMFAKEEHDKLPLLPGSNVHKEQYIDEFGGEMVIAGIHLFVPAGALNTGRVVSLSVSTGNGSRGPIASSSLRLTPLVNFGPINLVLQKPVIVMIPHCAIIGSQQTGLDVYCGISQKADKKIKWSLERKYLSCSMNRNYLRVEIQRPCGIIGPHMPFHPKMIKHVYVAPIKERPSSPEDELTISLWFYNDDNLEHDSLVHEEIYNNKGIVLHDPVPFQLKTMGSTLTVSINSSGSTHFDINPESLNVHVNSLWLMDRQKLSFRVQTKGTKDAVNLEIISRYGVTDKVLFQFNIHLNVDDVHRLEQARSPFQEVLPQVTMGSFKELLRKIAEMVDTEESIDLAKNFQLTEDVIASIEAHRKPGILLMEMLNEECLISAANISRLEYALTEMGNEQCAKIVREFRRTNPVVHPTMVPEDHK